MCHLTPFTVDRWTGAKGSFQNTIYLDNFRQGNSFTSVDPATFPDC